MKILALLKKINLTKALIGLLIAVSVIAFVQSKTIHHLSEKNDRLNTRVTAADTQLKSMKDGLYQQTVAIESSKAEMRQYNDSLVQAMKEMDIKLNRLKYVSQTGLNIHAHVNAEIYDSIRTYLKQPKDTTQKPVMITETFKYLKYKDPYLTIDADLSNGKLAPIDIELPINLTIAGTGGKRSKHFLFFRYGPRIAQIKIKKDNPYATITYNKTIELK